MNILQLQYFLELAKHKSFKKTADANFVSQPAISTQISALEKEWGLKLFIRNYKDVELSPAGQILYENISHSFESFEKAMTRAKAVTNNPNSTIVVGIPEYFNILNLPEIFKEFQTIYPNVVLRIESAPIHQLYLEHSDSDYFDIVINQEVLIHQSEKFVIHPFMDGNYSFFISKDHPLCAGGHVPTLAELSGEIVYATAKSKEDFSIDHVKFVCKSQKCVPGDVRYLPNVNSTLLACMMGQGVCVLDDLITPPSEYNLLSIPTDIHISWLLVWKKNNPNIYLKDLAELIEQKITTVSDTNSER